jgi:hypothetical protein
MHRVLRRIGPVLFLFGAAECGTDPDEFGRCTGGLQVGVAYAPALQLHWTPADCSMFTLSIDDQGRSLMWDLSTIETRNGIESPVTYGVAPPGTDGTTAETMGPGRYRIVMTRIDADSRVVLAVDQEFTIPPAASAGAPYARWMRAGDLP